MLQKIVIAVFISAFISTFSHCMAQETKAKPVAVEQKIEAKQVEAVDKITKIGTRATATKPNNTERIKQRVENQVKRLEADYGLDAKQVEAVQKLWLETETQQNDLRSKLSTLNSERQKKFEELLTPEQKEKRNAPKAKPVTIEKK